MIKIKWILSIKLVMECIVIIGVVIMGVVIIGVVIIITCSISIFKIDT